MSYYVTGATIKEYDRLSYQAKLQDAIAQGRPLTQEMLERSGVDREKLNGLLKEMNWQPIPTFDEAVNKLAAQKKADILAQREQYQKSGVIDTNYSNSKWYGMTDEQITTETRREATVDIQRQIGKGELQIRRDDRPDSISASSTPRWQTDAKLLIEKYLPGLADLNTPEGIKTTAIEAFTASFVNARLFGATDFYVDQSRFHNERERDNAQVMNIAGSTIGELQNLTLAGKTVEAAMATTKVARGVQILNQSGRAGQLIVQALPSAATFGGLQAAKETVKAATGNSQGVVPAVTDVVKATTTGAVFGVFEPLPTLARVPAVAAGSYGVEKVFGASDKEAAMSALTNGLFSIAGGRGRAVEELAGKTIRVTGENGTATNVKVSVDAGKRIMLTEVAANVKADLQVKVSQIKAAAREVSANWGKNNRIFTSEQYEAAKTDLARYVQDYKGTLNGQWQPFPAQAFDPRIQAALTKIGGHHLEAGIRSFPEFVRKVRAEAEGAGMNWQTTRPYLERAYKDGLTAIKAEKEADLKGLQTYNQAERAQDLNKTIGVTSTQEIIGMDAVARAEFRQKINDANHAIYPKHIEARNNVEAQKFSSGKDGEAQYLPELKGKIETMEREAIWKAIDKGMVYRDLESSKGAYYFFYKFDKPIGYNNGKLTQWIRVELSNPNPLGKSDIHGHPTTLQEVRKRFPNVKE